MATDKVIEVQRGNPIPKSGCGRKAKYPFDSMKPGDSFDISLKRCKQKNPGSSVLTTAKMRGYKVSTRKVNKDTLRVWMVG